MVPLLDVVETIWDMEWRDHSISAIKDIPSLPHLLKIYRYIFEQGHHFSLFSEQDREQERKQRRGCIVGLSIVFNHLQIARVMRLNEGKREVTNIVVGYDYNSLYPTTMTHTMPMGACFINEP